MTSEIDESRTVGLDRQKGTCARFNFNVVSETLQHADRAGFLIARAATSAGRSGDDDGIGRCARVTERTPRLGTFARARPSKSRRASPWGRAVSARGPRTVWRGRSAAEQRARAPIRPFRTRTSWWTRPCPRHRVYSSACASARHRSESRVVRVTTGDANKEFKHRGNAISTGKYNLFTFFPKALYEQFRRVANMYFLSVAIISLSTPSRPSNPTPSGPPWCS